MLNTMHKRSARGFTMIETLVALVIISIGILGFALLQVESLKAAKTATERTKAIQFATDMLDRIRSNKLIYTNTAGVISLNITAYNSAISGPGAAGSICADLINSAPAPFPRCSINQMANYDLWQWRTAIADPKIGLGNTGKAGVSVTPTIPSTVTVTIQWLDRDEPKSYVLRSQLFDNQ